MPMESLNGTISGSIYTTGSISGSISAAVVTIDSYQGEYVVSPSKDAPVILETEGKQMLQDVIVRQIQETIAAEDDGYGNVTLRGEITVLDDGDGNITM